MRATAWGVCVLLAGCATVSSGHPMLSSELDERLTIRIAPTSSDRNVLTSADLAMTTASTTLDAIQRLRPEFLRPVSRPPSLGRGEVAVYRNSVYEGELRLLNTIPLTEIREIRFLNPAEATFKLGAFCRCAGGVILVTTRSASR